MLYFHSTPPPGRAYYGLSESELGARLRLMSFGQAVVSAQATLRSSGSLAGLGDRAVLSRGGLRGDGRISAGLGFKLFSFDGFLDVSLGARTPLRRIGAEAHVDVALGLRPVANVLVLAQAFSTFTAPSGSPARQSHKLLLSAVYDITRSVSLQAGAFATVLGVNTPFERGALTAVWLRF